MSNGTAWAGLGQGTPGLSWRWLNECETNSITQSTAPVSSMVVDVAPVEGKKKESSEILSYHAGCCVSHISLELSISIPDSGRRQGEIERQLLLLLCPLSSCYLSRRRIKGTNYILPQTFGLMSKQGSVVISALSPQPSCFSLSRATCSRARN